MRPSIARLSPKRCAGIVAGALLLAATSGYAVRGLDAQPDTAPQIPDLSGVWDGTRRSHPINSATFPGRRRCPRARSSLTARRRGRTTSRIFPS